MGKTIKREKTNRNAIEVRDRQDIVRMGQKRKKNPKNNTYQLFLDDDLEK